MTLLPLTLDSFRARRANETVALNWTTISESNSALFTIARSTDGATWTNIGRVPAAGYSSLPLSYLFSDTTLPHDAGILYYRLTLVDKGGKNAYAGVATVRMNDSTTGE